MKTNGCMLVDMHNHTRVSSPDSCVPPEELIRLCRNRGLNAICVTEHFLIEGANVAREIGQRMNFPVFRGIEARTEMGDMLVYGYYRDIPEFIPLADLCRMVHEAGGLVFAAHPYRAEGIDLYSCMRDCGLNLDRDWFRMPALSGLDGLEVINGKNLDLVNLKASLLASQLNLRGIGGSDAHHHDHVATAATRFNRPLLNEEDFLNALRGEEYHAIYLPSRLDNYLQDLCRDRVSL